MVHGISTLNFMSFSTQVNILLKPSEVGKWVIKSIVDMQKHNSDTGMGYRRL